MRTTIRLDDALYRQAKVKAAGSGRTVAEVIEDALRASLAAAEAQPPTPLPPLRTYGAGGLMPGVVLESNAALLDTLDDDTPADAKR